MKYVDELFVEIGKHRVLMAHATLIQGALAEIAELRSAARARAELDSLLSIACEQVSISPAGLTPQERYDLLLSRIPAATEYEVLPECVKNGHSIGDITIRRRIQRNGTVKWAVYHRGVMVLDRDGDWLHEPIPSSRSDEFIADTRFDLDDAWQRALKAVDREQLWAMSPR